MFNFDEKTYIYVSITTLPNGEKFFQLYDRGFLEEMLINDAPCGGGTLRRRDFALDSIEEIDQGKTVTIKNTIYKLADESEKEIAIKQDNDLCAEIDAMPMPTMEEMSDIVHVHKKLHPIKRTWKTIDEEDKADKDYIPKRR